MMTQGSSLSGAQGPRFTSPISLALLAWAFFLICWCIPKTLYTRYMMEPNVLFLDAAAFVLFALCAVFFCLGVAQLPRRVANPSLHPRVIATRMPGTAFLALPLILGIAVTTASVALLVKK